MHAADLAPSSSNVNQPPIPLSLSKYLVKRSLSNRENYRWLQSLSYHLGEDHLSSYRLHTNITANKRFVVGSRKTQTTRARLRLGHSSLNAHTARFAATSPLCQCGLSPETTTHFLLECNIYDSQREALRYRLSYVLASETTLTEGVLLGSANSAINRALYPSVAKATVEFVWRTERQP